jgi:hypothetical protein
MSFSVEEVIVVCPRREPPYILRRTAAAEKYVESLTGDVTWDTGLAAVGEDFCEAYMISGEYHPSGTALELVEAPCLALTAWRRLSNAERAALGLPTDDDIDDPEEYFRMKEGA